VTLPPAQQVALAQKYGRQYGVDPRLLLAIGGHETQWGTTGAGRPGQGGYVLGYGVTDSGILSKYAGLKNQYLYGAKTLSGWGVHNLNDVMSGKASRWATDPAWEKGVQSVYGTLPGSLPSASVPATPAVTPASTPRSVVIKTPVPRSRTVTQRVYDPGKVGQGIFSALAQGDLPDISSLVQNAYTNVTSQVPLPPGVKRTVVTHGALPAGQDAPSSPKGIGNRVVQAAAKQLGQPYVWGGESRKEGGFDCSGLVDWALRACGVNLPGRLTTQSALHVGHSVKGQPLKPGDMMIVHNGQHMVLYAGNGKVIAAPHTGTNVQYQDASMFSGLVDVRRL
jgi:cell wall-associated NlpC family hydrolase